MGTMLVLNMVWMKHENNFIFFHTLNNVYATLHTNEKALLKWCNKGNHHQLEVLKMTY